MSEPVPAITRAVNVDELNSMQQVQEVPAHGVVVGLDVDAPAAVRIVIPVAEHGAEARHQVIGDLARAGRVVIVCLGQYTTQRRRAGAQDVHWMARGRQLLEHRADRRGDAAQALELHLVRGQLAGVRQPAVDQQVGDLLELAGLRHLEDVVAAIVQVVAAAADAAQRRVARRDARQGDGFLRFREALAHGFFSAANKSSSFAS
jgi:hypothetical protein